MGIDLSLYIMSALLLELVLITYIITTMQYGGYHPKL